MNMQRSQYGFLLLLLSLTLLPAVSLAKTATKVKQQSEIQRIVSVGGGLTEIIYALGAESKLVGVDTTSKWPASAKELPQVGYQRKLSAEGILSLAPDLLIATGDAGPAEVIQKLENAGLRIVHIPKKQSMDGVVQNIRLVAQTLGKQTAGEALISKLKEDYQGLQAQLSQLKHQPSVAFFLGVNKGTPMAAGAQTGANQMIRMAGANNAFAAFTGYKPISQEALISAAPEVILIAKHAMRDQSLTDVLKNKGIAATPAAQNNKVILVDTLLMLGFGPRIVEALETMVKQIHPEEQPAQ